MSNDLNKRSVLISILNWNTAEKTIECVHALRALDKSVFVQIRIIIIDNGSSPSDYDTLQKGLRGGSEIIHREKVNLGFAGGHNIAIRKSLVDQDDFIWLVNSDAIVATSDVLTVLIAEMEANPSCGAVSPLITDFHDEKRIDFSGAIHDWVARQSIRLSISACERAQEDAAENVWVIGTAVLFRLAAIRIVGVLNERMFAYYEDDEIGARLSAQGWSSRVAFGAKVMHAEFRQETDRPSYYFYLMQRNSLIFWYEQMPGRQDLKLYVSLIDQAFYETNKLYFRGYTRQADAALLGIRDFVCRQYGEYKSQRKISIFLRLVQKLIFFQQRRVIERTLNLSNE